MHHDEPGGGSLVLTLTDVRKSFGKIVAVDGLSLAVRKGELLGLLGPNGAGKSTSVSLSVGLLSPDAGTVAIEGYGNPADPAVRQRIGVAPQSLALYDALTGEENLRFFGEVYGLSGATLEQRVTWCLEFAGLIDRKGDRVEGYSGGMKRRLNMAAAVIHDPELLLFDEPTVGVDPQSRNKIFESIEALHRDGRTIIYTTHYMEEAERLCDRIAIVDAGKLLALGTLDELLAAHGGPPTLIVQTHGEEQRLQVADPLAELNRLAATSPIERFQMERPTLEQVFLRLTGRSLRD
jgi:ABC-2 type transport system ATP-binding protein